MVIEWADRAKWRLRSIFDYYNLVAGREIATALVTDIKNAVKSLLKFPKMAAVEPYLIEFPQEFRSLVVRRHFKVIYFVTETKIYIVTIWDCRQNPDNLKFEIVS